ncbi:MAG: hypothetical protein KUF80_08825 [Candidatus Thiodiazotropha sp. (ex Codakia orbicularis)]|nr:hypothetical protein [Candidatus Thiodiazotropha sp. (ex Codakia orbicularis)]
MKTRSQLETEIANSLAHLSAEDMQRVAEDYARIRFPNRFPCFHFRAFSGEGKSRKGWPDAWIEVDGRIDGVEATAASQWSAVRRHLDEDLGKAIGRVPPLAGLVIVSGHPAVQPNSEQLVAYRQRFIDEAGIDADRLELVFGGGLVEELVRPEFARTRIEVLRLEDSPRHFELVRARRGPDEGRLNSAFIPTEEDYEARRVHRPAAADEALAHLQQTGRALIRGVGASGKTVLAWLLALEVAERRRPAYYLDFARYAQITAEITNGLIADLHRFAHPDSLFVLDNCHLEEAVAKAIALGWEDIYKSQRPKLLLVGRELRTARGSAIDGLSIPTIPLRARQPEVLGVYRRLVGRHFSMGEVPLPPPDALDDWVRTFGDDPEGAETTTDLIAFSAAVMQRMRQLLRHDWTLTARDAVDEVRDVYLNKLSVGEARNLMLLCACQEIELALAEEGLPDRSAALHRSARRSGLVYRSKVGRSSTWFRYRLAHAALGKLIVDAAPEPVDMAVQRSEAALRNPHMGAAMVKRLAAIGSEDEAREVADQMLSRPECLTDMGTLNWVQLFLRVLHQLGISLSRDIRTALISSANRQRLAERALETPLGYLANFLGYAAKTEQLKDVFAALAEDLAAEKNRERLAERALETPLEHLANFVGYTARTPKLKLVYSTLTEELAKPANRSILAAVLEQQPLEKVVSALSSDAAPDFWIAVFTAIDIGRWAQARRAEATPKVSPFVSFQRMATHMGRPEFSEAPAQRLIVGSTPEEWHQPGIGLHHLSHVIRLARGVSPVDLERFLDRVATPEWVDFNYEVATTGGLAGALHSFASTLEPDRRRWFQRETLRKRIGRELARRPMHDAESLSQALSLCGAATAMGVSIPTTQADWPGTGELADVLDLRAPDLDQTIIGPLQVQLWLGLREMARLSADRLIVSPRHSDCILDLWIATHESESDSQPPRVRALNVEMINWLHQCKAAGWRLVPPRGAPAVDPAEGTA